MKKIISKPLIIIIIVAVVLLIYLSIFYLGGLDFFQRSYCEQRDRNWHGGWKCSNKRCIEKSQCESDCFLFTGLGFEYDETKLEKDKDGYLVGECDKAYYCGVFLDQPTKDVKDIPYGLCF